MDERVPRQGRLGYGNYASQARLLCGFIALRVYSNPRFVQTLRRIVHSLCPGKNPYSAAMNERQAFTPTGLLIKTQVLSRFCQSGLRQRWFIRVRR
jgi:hypothetical protein